MTASLSSHPGRALVLVAALYFAGLAAAQEGTSRIAKVTVYPGSATVERVAKVSAGARGLTVSCLPATLDTQSLQVDADSGVRVGEIKVLTEDRSLVPQCASPLDDRIRALEDQIAAVRAEASGLALVDSYLKSVASATPGAGGDNGARTSAPPPIASTVQVLRSSAQASAERAHQLKRKQEALEQSLKPLVAERDRVASQRARVVTLHINLAAERDAELRLSYQVRGPGWQPNYRAMLNTERQSLRIERLALVAQNTGEDWSGVQLILSTGQPGRATAGRLPRAWTLDVITPAARTDAAERAMAMGEPMPAPPAPAPAAMAAKPAEAAMPSFDVSAFDRSFATEFSVPQRISVPSSGERVSLVLASQQASATLLARTAPGVEEAAYLVAEVTPPTGVWPAGTVGLYRDDAYVGTGRLDFNAANAGTTSLSFGRDELVRVRAEPAQNKTSTTGLTGSTTERQIHRSYQVENRHKSAIEIQVLHAAPVSRNDKIEVQSRYQPQPADTAWNKQPGTIAWRQKLGAGASATFVADHTLRYAKDLPVQEHK